MKSRILFLFAACTVALCALPSLAEVKVIVDLHAGDSASAAFRFANVPPASQNDAASKATFTLVSGQRDRNGGDLAVLHDGSVPTEEDQPASNFFFNAGLDGGRLLVDLGSAIDIKQVNTYSWHPGSRGPQVYGLYASDGSDGAFNPQPQKGTDPQTCGWKLIAKVDARPQQGEIGGQYGVSISDSAGLLGKYRYLLFDVSRTEGDDPFGNTFFSEIDVVDPTTTPAPGSPSERGAGRPSRPKAASTRSSSTRPTRRTWPTGRRRNWLPSCGSGIPSSSRCCPARATRRRRGSASRSAPTCRALRPPAALAFGAPLRGSART